MATLYAQSTGNWSAITWNTAANGSGSNQTPAAADTLVSNGYTVTVDANYTVTKVTNTGGGTFSLANGVTLTCTEATAGVVGDATNVGAVTMSLASPNAATLAAKVNGGDGANEYGVSLSGTGQITINGTVTGGTFVGTDATGADGVYISAGGTLIVNAAVTGGSGQYSKGINCGNVAATITITGNVVGSSSGYFCPAINNSGPSTITVTGTVAGGAGSYADAINNSGPSTITVTGNVTGGAVAYTGYGINNSGASTITVTGNVTAGAIPGIRNTSAATLTHIGACVPSSGANAISSSAGTVQVTGPLYANASGKPSLYCTNWYWYSAAVGSLLMEVYTNSTPIAKRSLYSADALPGVPAAANVRQGTAYGPTNELTGTCAVPAAAAVLYGVNVDATTGTATLAAADIRAALGLASANLDTQLSGISAKTGNLPASPAAVGSAMTLTAAYDLAKTASQFNPATDVVARVTLADTVTTLTNAPDVPTEAEIAAAVWAYVTRTITSGGITAQEVWEYVSTLLPDGAETLLSGIAERLAEQVPTGPVIVVPAPGAGQTTAWAMCYDSAGVVEEGVSISVKLVSATSGGSAYDKAAITATSDAAGLVSLAIPRGADLRFSARRGSGPWTAFSGVDAETLELPALLGNP